MSLCVICFWFNKYLFLVSLRTKNSFNHLSRYGQVTIPQTNPKPCNTRVNDINISDILSETAERHVSTWLTWIAIFKHIHFCGFSAISSRFSVTIYNISSAGYKRIAVAISVTYLKNITSKIQTRNWVVMGLMTNDYCLWQGEENNPLHWNHIVTLFPFPWDDLSRYEPEFWNLPTHL